MQATMQAARTYAAEAAMVEQNITWCGWMKELQDLLHSTEMPSVLVTVKWQGEKLRPKRHERIVAASAEWLCLCELKEYQVTGRRFRDIPGFQGPLTTEASKLAFASLLITEEPSVKSIHVVNYTARTRKAISMLLNVDILRWRGQNMVFLCSIVGHRDALCLESPIVGSARRAAVALRAATSGNEHDSESGTEADTGADTLSSTPSLPVLWHYLIESHSEVIQHEHESGAHCSICCNVSDVGDSLRILTCGHRYHMSCIDNWFLHQIQSMVRTVSLTSALSEFSCPICKQDPLASRDAYLQKIPKVPRRPSGKPRRNLPTRHWFPSILQKAFDRSLVIPASLENVFDRSSVIPQLAGNS